MSNTRAASQAGGRRLLLINPQNELVAITNTEDNLWNRFRVWKPLGLMVLAGRTPPEWDVQIIDENLGKPDYDAMPLPDLVGISAFTSQANAAYALAERFRRRGVKVVIGGVHATMRTEEAAQHADVVVTGEADDVWQNVLEDAKNGTLKKLYEGKFADMSKVPPARHDLLPKGYFFGSLQVSRGCPVHCNFCSVTEFSGTQIRSRPIEAVIEEMRKIPEKYLLIVDDNLIGTTSRQIAYAKDLFRAMAKAKLGKRWMGQVTINFADDDELLDLAFEAGCFGMLIGFESPSAEGLRELAKTFNTKKGRDLAASVRNIQKHRMVVCGSFALGLDVDRRGAGRRIAEAGHAYGIDVLNALFLTPLPGTRLFRRMEEEGRLIANDFPSDWRYYTFTYPVAKFQNLGWPDAVEEMHDISRHFYNFPRIAYRATRTLLRTRTVLGFVVGFATSLSYRFNRKLERKFYGDIDMSRETRARAPVRPHVNGHVSPLEHELEAADAS